jgi:hypothetical protein
MHSNLEIAVSPSTRVEIFVLAPESDDCGDLMQAASTSTDFWDNPWDDEDWNNGGSYGHETSDTPKALR